MALTKEDLQAISSIVRAEVQPLKEDIRILQDKVQGLQDDVKVLQDNVKVLQDDVKVLQDDVKVLQDDVKVLQDDVKVLKDDVRNLKADMQKAQDDIHDMKLHLENVTDRNINLLVENYTNLVKKLDENNEVTDLQIAYQIKVNYLMEDVAILKREVKELKNQSTRELKI